MKMYRTWYMHLKKRNNLTLDAPVRISLGTPTSLSKSLCKIHSYEWTC